MEPTIVISTISGNKDDGFFFSTLTSQIYIAAVRMILISWLTCLHGEHRPTVEVLEISISKFRGLFTLLVIVAI